MNRIGPRHEMCRRVGAALCGRPSCPARRRPYPPGQHGPRTVLRPKEYGKRLFEKQKLRAIYGVPEGQMQRYYRRAASRPRNTGEELIRELETRLDALVHRLGFSVSMRQARRLVSQGHVRVDGKRLDVPSAAVRPGQRISLSEKARRFPVVQDALTQSLPIPAYLQLDREALAGLLVRQPERDEIPLPVEIDERLIVEHYA